MRLMADKTGERFLTILEQDGDRILVQFISANGELQGRPFHDSLRSFEMVGWQTRRTSTAIGLQRFKQGYLEDAHVSFALHQLFPLGRKVRLPNGETVTIASYANTHADGYYMYIKIAGKDTLERKRMTPEWQLLPDDTLLALPYYPAPKTPQELANISEFDQWAGGF
ncbi:hypothetical protein [Motilimonas pumila]|uniref:Uncharacterized protein n=1 Tax=Motilimonas pumila TaxID=2303987 RepID=A0A418YCQ2_9GAMM|nr:hypothetical protein [Motilimonas pumila]RJG42275.1 hypothetical protein D1Z90_14330 [Motilimonas pumila]